MVFSEMRKPNGIVDCNVRHLSTAHVERRTKSYYKGFIVAGDEEWRTASTESANCELLFPGAHVAHDTYASLRRSLRNIAEKSCPLWNSTCSLLAGSWHRLIFLLSASSAFFCPTRRNGIAMRGRMNFNGSLEGESGEILLNGHWSKVYIWILILMTWNSAVCFWIVKFEENIFHLLP